MKTQTEIKEISIKDLITENLQIRVAMQEECIADYAAIYREDPKALPPVTVFAPPLSANQHYLADGFHHVEAAKRAGCDTIMAEVIEGTFDDALKFALSANDKHGLRRTNADKRNAMEIAWKNRKNLFTNSNPTERQLATLCGVSNGTAHNFMIDIGLLKMSKIESHTPAADAAVGSMRGLSPDTVRGLSPSTTRADSNSDSDSNSLEGTVPTPADGDCPQAPRRSSIGQTTHVAMCSNLLHGRQFYQQ